jgi:hypothetical protein
LHGIYQFYTIPLFPITGKHDGELHEQKFIHYFSPRNIINKLKFTRNNRKRHVPPPSGPPSGTPSATNALPAVEGTIKHVNRITGQNTRLKVLDRMSTFKLRYMKRYLTYTASNSSLRDEIIEIIRGKSVSFRYDRRTYLIIPWATNQNQKKA